MNFYARHILPWIIDSVCQGDSSAKQRAKIIPFARGRVLEIGFGSGLNLEYYDKSKVEMVWGLEPSIGMWERAGPRLKKTSFPVERLELSGEEIPLEDNTADSVLVTYTLCTIPDVKRALVEMRRVLKPGGELIFCEHGLAPDEKVALWQRRMNPIWKRIGGGCNLNRPIPTLIEQAGFRIKHMEADYIGLLKPAMYNYWGTATGY